MAQANHVKTMAIIGAGGTIGSYIAKALIAAGKHKVTAITRPDSNSEMPEGLHAVRKAEDHASLVDAMKGQEALIITLSARAPKEAQTKLIDAAVEAGVKYIVPNEYGSDESDESLVKETILGDAAIAIRQYIEKAGRGKTHWIALTCSFWYEFSLAGSEARFGFDFDKKTLTLFDDGTTKICASTWAQVGRAAASLFALKVQPADANDKALTLSEFEDKAVLFQSFVVSQRDMLESVLRVTGDKKSEWTITSEDSHERYRRGVEMMQSGNMVGFAMLLYTRIFYPNGGGDYSHKVINKQLGLPEEDLDEATKFAIQLHKDEVFQQKMRG